MPSTLESGLCDFSANTCDAQPVSGPSSPEAGCSHFLPLLSEIQYSISLLPSPLQSYLRSFTRVIVRLGKGNNETFEGLLNRKYMVAFISGKPKDLCVLSFRANPCAILQITVIHTFEKQLWVSYWDIVETERMTMGHQIGRQIKPPSWTGCYPTLQAKMAGYAHQESMVEWKRPYSFWCVRVLWSE